MAIVATLASVFTVVLFAVFAVWMITQAVKS